MKSNHQLSSKVGTVLEMSLCTKLDGDELFESYKDFHKKKKDLTGRVEHITVDRGKLAKIMADFEAWLKELESKLKEFEQRATREREVRQQLEEELLIYKNEVLEQHEKGFKKVVKQAGFFQKDLDLGLFDPFNCFWKVIMTEFDCQCFSKDLVNYPCI